MDCTRTNSQVSLQMTDLADDALKAMALLGLAGRMNSIKLHNLHALLFHTSEAIEKKAVTCPPWHEVNDELDKMGEEISELLMETLVNSVKKIASYCYLDKEHLANAISTRALSQSSQSSLPLAVLQQDR